MFVSFIEREIVQDVDLFESKGEQLTHGLNFFEGFVAERTIRLGINDDRLQGSKTWLAADRSPDLNRISSENLVD